MTRVETVVSELLPDLPATPAPDRDQRAVDPAYQQSIDDELTESYHAYCLRQFGEAS